MPIITISRTYCSGGSQIAASLASTLAWSLLDNAVIDEVAARTGLSTSEVAAREERRPSLAERVATAMAMSTQEMLSPIAAATLPLTDERLMDVTRHVIEEACARGPAVIVGRGAQMMLGARSDVFGVMCYAPREALVRQCMHRDSLDHEQAAKRVDEVNKRRADWVRATWGRDWAALENYHLCVNTDALGMDGAADVILRAARDYFRIES
ncbi:MAG TPA: cytidylate kinase-like family protein [Candidatus Elarobacter sp.]|nr:cytidylate kinase-like family protein [Candidatus Elarobacter sp.]